MLRRKITISKVAKKQFCKKIGLIVEKPKPGGSGFLNDGNTARKFLVMRKTAN